MNEWESHENTESFRNPRKKLNLLVHNYDKLEGINLQKNNKTESKRNMQFNVKKTTRVEEPMTFLHWEWKDSSFKLFL